MKREFDDKYISNILKEFEKENAHSEVESFSEKHNGNPFKKHVGDLVKAVNEHTERFQNRFINLGKVAEFNMLCNFVERVDNRKFNLSVDDTLALKKWLNRCSDYVAEFGIVTKDTRDYLEISVRDMLDKVNEYGLTQLDGPDLVKFLYNDQDLIVEALQGKKSIEAKESVENMGKELVDKLLAAKDVSNVIDMRGLSNDLAVASIVVDFNERVAESLSCDTVTLGKIKELSSNLKDVGNIINNSNRDDQAVGR